MKGNFYIVGTSAHSLVNFRFDLIKTLSTKYKVFALSHDKEKNVTKKLKKIKALHVCYGRKKKSFMMSFNLFRYIQIFLFQKKKFLFYHTR